MNVMERRVSEVSPEERALREDLAACYRIFAGLGWVELIYNHITLRIPGPEHHFLINPFGLMYGEVTASNLVKCDLQGNIIGPSGYPVNKAGFVLHSAIHANVPEAQCIMHTHTTAGMAVACKRDGLAMTNFYSAQLYGQVAYHAFEGVTVNLEEQRRVLASMAGKRQLVLRNHGLLVWGETISEAFARMWTLNRACEIQLASQSLSGEDNPISPAVCEQAVREAFQFKPEYGAGRDVFDALKRQVEIRDPGYKL